MKIWKYERKDPWKSEGKKFAGEKSVGEKSVEEESLGEKYGCNVYG